MTIEWSAVEIGNVCEISSSKRIFANEYVASGIPFYGSKEIIDKALGSFVGPAAYISEQRFSEIAIKFGFPDKGDLLLSSVGNRAGIPYVVSNEGKFYFKDGNITWFRKFKGLDSDFLCYWLKSSIGQESLNAIMIGSAQKALTINGLSKLKIMLPKLSQQKMISNSLKVIDDRITLLRETNLTLEAIAQAMFKSWFVDFDPVRAKQEGRQPEGTDQATAELFSDSFEQSEFGEIPAGWTLEALDKNINFLNGLALQKFPPTGINDLPVIKIAQLRKGDAIGADLAASSLKPEYVVKDGDVLFSWSGSLEVEIWCGGEGALNQHLFKVTSLVYPRWFIYLWTRKHLNNFREIAASKATTMGHIQRSHLSAAKILVPDKKLLDAINSIISPLIDKVIENNLQARTLSSIRDALLPRLISGQLRLREVEKEIEVATA
jgi:type I restriction enzyme S subunit